MLKTGRVSIDRRRLSLAVVVFLAAVLLLIVIIIFHHKKPVLSSAQTIVPMIIPSAGQAKNYRGLPVRLKIPAIAIDASVKYVGNTSNGDMEVTKGLVDVGWYKYGSLPGDDGSSVIEGHVVGFKGESGVFSRLDELKPGDSLSVIDAKGGAATFTVRDTKTYDPTQQHAEVFNSASGAHLNLITCSGDWDSSHRHYLKRLVVFADMSSAI